MLKGGHAAYKDENEHDVTVEDFHKALTEWIPFINSIRDWRSGRFTITLTEWNLMPPITKELIELHDKIASQIKPKKKP